MVVRSVQESIAVFLQEGMAKFDPADSIRSPGGTTPRFAQYPPLRRLAQLDYREMSAPRKIGDLKLEALASPPANWRTRCGTGSVAWPVSPWLVARSLRSRLPMEVCLVWRGRFEGAVRAVTVVPGDEKPEFAADGSVLQRHKDPAKRFFLHGPDETLDDRDAAVLPHGPEALSNPATPAPRLEARVGELRTVIGDEVGWWPAGFPDHTHEKLSDTKGCGLCPEDLSPHDST